MLHHVSVGVRDVERAALFYDAVLAALGYKRVMEFLPYAVAYGVTQPSFWIQLPHDQQVASPGNGTHVSFVGRTRNAVNRFHKTALEKGGIDNGSPGPRPDYGPDYYGAFVIDLDGNKIEATLLPEASREKSPKMPVRKAARKAAKKAPAKKKKAKRR
ncbi:MAG: VOC family protein [Alphaproteobacteria bacterium]|nr:VOC family protein [Alphaproteobacteria bacterium]